MKRAAAVFLGLITIGVVVLLVLSTRTKLEFHPQVRVIGSETEVGIKLENPHGIRSIGAWVEQKENRHLVHQAEFPSTRWWFFGKNEPSRTVKFAAGKKQAPALEDGKARLIVEVESNDFRSANDSIAAEVEVNTRPPAIVVDGHQHYINQGGAELITFIVSGYAPESGVRSGQYTFRSFAMPGELPDSAKRFSLFAFPWDLPAGTEVVAFARNPTGAEATARPWQKIFPKRFRSRQLELTDDFLKKVVNDIDPSGTGDLLERFLKINGEMRKQNNERLAALKDKTAEKPLWSGPFVQLSNSKVESQFADVRDYVYKGKKVDRQTHLGFDLSVTKNVPVVAGNSGSVILAERLGIYGNCVVVDHGYGLQSIYGHLSEVSVKPGDSVSKGQTLGKSGDTGLAGGDHLHFSMQVDGVQVNPVEWWDDHWIQDRILSKLPVK
jgi:murein DD-endopeptidase MepM/ murein hydrolase activator NlpD